MSGSNLAKCGVISTVKRIINPKGYIPTCLSGLNSGTFILRDDEESKLIETEPESSVQ